MSPIHYIFYFKYYDIGYIFPYVFKILNYELLISNIFFCGGSVNSVDYGSIHNRWFPSCLCQIVADFVVPDQFYFI